MDLISLLDIELLFECLVQIVEFLWERISFEGWRKRKK